MSTQNAKWRIIFTIQEREQKLIDEQLGQAAKRNGDMTGLTDSDLICILFLLVHIFTNMI